METERGADRVAVARHAIEDCVALQRQLLEPHCLSAIVRAAEWITDSLMAGGKLLLFGNGGSASDASHIATEFVARFMRDRRALPALSLSADHAALTAIANDFGFERVFARQLEAMAAPGDVAVAISTSGRSRNVLAGAEVARSLGVRTIGLTGGLGGELASSVDLCLRVPSDVTARVQEGHILIAHILCELVEQDLA
jgi:D-sedoheptulose 7-phosphate isomerase